MTSENTLPLPEKRYPLARLVDFLNPLKKEEEGKRLTMGDLLDEKMADQCIDCSNLPLTCKKARKRDECDERERETYNCGVLSGDTMWCHHLDEATGKHVVLHDLPTIGRKKCGGVIYFSVGFKGKAFTCGKMRPKGKGHDRCTAARCPYMRDGKECPFMQNAPEALPLPGGK